MADATPRTPWHLWLVGVFALLFNWYSRRMAKRGVLR